MHCCCLPSHTHTSLSTKVPAIAAKWANTLHPPPPFFVSVYSLFQIMSRRQAVRLPSSQIIHVMKTCDTSSCISAWLRWWIVRYAIFVLHYTWIVNVTLLIDISHLWTPMWSVTAQTLNLTWTKKKESLAWLCFILKNHLEKQVFYICH